MGIRYFAHAVGYAYTSEQVSDSLAVRRSQYPATLDLDKAFRSLQNFTRPKPGMQSRPAFAMFEGAVTDTDYGYLPFERALGAAEVQEIAADLAAIDDEDVAADVRAHPVYRDPGDREAQYVLSYLRQAREFMATLAANGQGIVYTIG
ncbi:protein of unknown function [Gordonia malaquae]|uniref:DUF1877 family protein n=1 Tax=Gordonia malaquae NBRC 108250 TaxID=1223542 RepID=M3V9F9_GORML|nr:DUF1877 family protein [Gordonia malaquae]GAC77898.1 hypothetical protein GM1_001_00210 [Gordonia malaquae NBRC 108250]SED83879.1 protein of unknown function [Gordonia malaquae]